MLLQISEETSENLARIFCNIPWLVASCCTGLQDDDDELCIIVYADRLLEKTLSQPIMALCSMNEALIG